MTALRLVSIRQAGVGILDMSGQGRGIGETSLSIGRRTTLAWAYRIQVVRDLADVCFDPKLPLASRLFLTRADVGARSHRRRIVGDSASVSRLASTTLIRLRSLAHERRISAAHQVEAADNFACRVTQCPPKVSSATNFSNCPGTRSSGTSNVAEYAQPEMSDDSAPQLAEGPFTAATMVESRVVTVVRRAGKTIEFGVPRP